MKRRLWMVLAMLAVAAWGRTWTSTKGTTMEAEFVSAQNDSVTVRKADGTTTTIGLMYLSQADRDFVKSEKKEMPVTGASAFGSEPTARKDLLTDEQIAELKTELPGKSNSRFVFQCNFYQRTLDEKELRRLKNGQIPYRITAELLEVKTQNGKSKAERMPGYVRFYLLDEDKNVLVSKKQSLDSMCPT